MDLARAIGLNHLPLHTEHSNLSYELIGHYLRTIFFVVLTFFLKIGLVCPPKPFCLASYLRLPIGLETYRTLCLSGICALLVLGDLVQSMLLALVRTIGPSLLHHSDHFLA